MGWERRFDDNQSIWLDDKEPYRDAPSLQGQLEVDLAIIGGGFTGVSTAYHLSKRFPDLGIALVEAKRLANGASGRNGGQMLNWVHGFDAGGPEEARRIYQATREGIEGIAAIIEEHRLRVPFLRNGHLEVFTQTGNAELGEQMVESLAGAGLPLRFLRGAALKDYIQLEGALGAILDPEGGQLDGVAFLRELRPVLEARGVRVFENTPVVRIEEGRTVELTTQAARVRAQAIVLATNAYTPHLGYFAHQIVPIHSHVIGTEPRSSEDWADCGWKSGDSFTDDRGRLSYGTLTASGRLLFGGGSNATYDYLYGNGTGFAGSASSGFEAAHRHLLDYLPALGNVAITRKWSGPVALTLSRLCTMGVRGTHRNVYYALGYSGHGVTLANLAGRVLCDIYSDADERWRGLPFYQQKLRFIPPEPFRWLGYQLYTRLTGQSPRSSH